MTRSSVSKKERLAARAQRSRRAEKLEKRHDSTSPSSSLETTELSKHTPKRLTLDIVTERNARNSPLLRLPPELRNKIFAYVFSVKTIGLRFTPTCPGRCVISVQYDNHSDWRYGKVYFNQTLACKQIYHETYLLPYILNDFASMRSTRRSVEDFLAGLEEKRRAVIDRKQLDYAWSVTPILEV